MIDYIVGNRPYRQGGLVGISWHCTPARLWKTSCIPAVSIGRKVVLAPGGRAAFAHRAVNTNCNYPPHSAPIPEADRWRHLHRLDLIPL